MRPFQLTPLFKSKPWGGRRLSSFGKDLPDGPIGESWEVADLPASIADPGRTLVRTGRHAGRSLRALIDRHGTDLLGSSPPWGDGDFPLLIKFLDAREPLSIQVHPGPEYTARHPDAHTKSESWYVMAAAPNAAIFTGVRQGVSRAQLREAAGTPELVSLLRTVPAVAGELHDVPAGTIHAIGGGVLAAEIQTPSDTTFRLYDWTEEYPRPPRPLHLHQALAAVDVASRPDPIPPMRNGSRRLVTTPYYGIDEHSATTIQLPARRLTVVMVVAGVADLARERHEAGATIVVPAAASSIDIDASAGTVLCVSLGEDHRPWSGTYPRRS